MSDKKDIFARADEFIAAFKQGADFTRVLLKEHERLRMQLVQLDERQQVAAESPEE